MDAEARSAVGDDQAGIRCRRIRFGFRCGNTARTTGATRCGDNLTFGNLDGGRLNRGRYRLHRFSHHRFSLRHFSLRHFSLRRLGLRLLDGLATFGTAALMTRATLAAAFTRLAFAGCFGVEGNLGGHAFDIRLRARAVDDRLRLDMRLRSVVALLGLMALLARHLGSDVAVAVVVALIVHVVVEVVAVLLLSAGSASAPWRRQ